MQLPTLSALKLQSNVEIAKVSSLAAPIGAILVSVLVALLIVWPKFSEVLRLKGANEELVLRAQALSEKVNTLSSLDRTELEGQLTASEQILPSDKGVFTLVAQIERTAAASGVLLNRLEVAPGQVTQSKAEIPPPAPTTSQQPKTDIETVAESVQLKVALSSDYKSFIQFLNILSSISRVIAIRDLTISSTSVSGESVQVRVSLQIDGFWKALPSQLASVESPIELLTESEISMLAQVQRTGFAGTSAVPQVPLGRSDLFAPF